MNIVLMFSQYAAVLTKFNSIIGRKFAEEAGVFAENFNELPLTFNASSLYNNKL